MDWVFPAPSVNRLARKNNNRSGQSSQERVVQNQMFTRQGKQATHQKNNDEKSEKEENGPSRYWANRRIQAVKKQEEQIVKTQQSNPPENQRYGANRRIEKKEQKSGPAELDNKNQKQKYSAIDRKDRRDMKRAEQSNNQETPRSGSGIQPRYGANRRIQNISSKQETSNQPTKKQESSASRRLQRKPNPNLHSQTPKKDEEYFQPITARYAPIKRTTNPPVSASQLKGQKLKEVQSIVRRPLANQRDTAQEEIPKSEENRNEPKKVASSFIDDIFKPVPRRGRYGQQVKQRNNQVKTSQITETNEKKTPQKLLTRTNRNQQISRVRKPAQPSPTNPTDQNPSVLSLESNLQSNQNAQLTKIDEKNQMNPSSFRRGRPDIINTQKQDDDQPKQVINSQRMRGYQNQTRRTQEKSEPQTQQSSIISNTPQNRLKREQLSSQTSKIQQNNPRTSPRPNNNLTSKLQKEGQSQKIQKPSQVSLKKPSNILIHLISQLYFSKIHQNFQIFLLNTQKTKKKEQIYGKILITAMINLISKQNYETIEVLAHQLLKPDTYSIKISEISKRQEIITKKTKQILPKMINLLFNSQIRSSLMKLRENVTRMKTSMKGVQALSRIQGLKMKVGFEKIKQFSGNRGLIKKRLLEKILNTCRMSYFLNLSQGWIRLQKNHCGKIQAAEEEQSQEPGTPAFSSPQTPVFSPSKRSKLKPLLQTSSNNSLLLKSKKQYEAIQTQYTKQKEEWNISLNKHQQQLDILRGNCIQEEQAIDQKKRVEQILQQKVNELQALYPQRQLLKQETTSEIQQTKYSQLLQLYLTFLKNRTKQSYLTGEIEDILPFQNAQSDTTVIKWKALLENKKLKELIQCYEEVQKQERKIAYILEKQCEMVTGLVRNYVKQAYIWGWVKNVVRKIDQ